MRQAAIRKPSYADLPTQQYFDLAELLAKHRRCRRCLAGEHDIDSTIFPTQWLVLRRKRCLCQDCACDFLGVEIEQPRWDQRHALASHWWAV